MARLPRLTLPGVPHHLLQRGNNRQAVFVEPADYQLMLDLLAQHAQAQQVSVHAFLLMESQFHLLATPQTQQGIPQLMQALGRAYVRHFNRARGRSGTLWEGRYRSVLLEPDEYLLPAMVYLDTLPVRAHLSAEAESYRWSSHSHYVGRAHCRFLTPPGPYWLLGNTPFAREAAYAERVQAGLAPGSFEAIRSATESGWPLGGPEFLRLVEAQANRRAVKAQAGRPASRNRSVPD